MRGIEKEKGKTKRENWIWKERSDERIREEEATDRVEGKNESAEKKLEELKEWMKKGRGRKLEDKEEYGREEDKRD